MSALLAVEGLSVTFGRVEALADVSFSLEPGTVTGLIGPNGAGKTTLIDALTGFVPTRGTVRLGSVRLDGLSAHRRTALGIARTFQSVELFDDLTVDENLQVAAECTDDAARAAHAAERAGVARLGDRSAADLGPGQRRQVALARALAAGPRLLLLDEPAAGLDVAERAALVEQVRALASEGVTILLVDHDVPLVLDVADRVLVLDLGALIADAPPADVRDDPRVARAYLGVRSAPPEAAEEPVRSPGPSVVRTLGLAGGYGGPRVLHGLDLEVRAGEVVALLGANGAGKTTTLRALAGTLPERVGAVEVLGRRGGSTHRLARAGLAYVVQGRGRVFTTLTVAENLRLSSRRSSAIDSVLQRFPPLEPLLRRSAGQLSGGEQQLLAVARALASEPRLLLLDELSLGLAPSTVAQLLGALAALAAETAMAVVFAEQHTELALTVADRAYVLARGRVVDADLAARLRREPDRLARAYLGTA